MNPPYTPSYCRSGWFWVVVIALAARAGYCALAGPVSQYREYVIAGARLAEHGALLSPLMTDERAAEASGLMPPLYVFWVAGVYVAFGIETFAANLVLMMANALAGAFACGLTYKIAEVLWSRKAAWWAGLIAALNPALIGFTNYIWDTCFFALAITVCVWTAVWLRGRPLEIRRFFCFGVLLGVVALLNPALTVTYPLLVLFPVLRNQGFRGAAKPVFLTLLGWLLIVTPWTVRNWIQLGSPAYVRTGFMLELWLGVVPEADMAGGDVYRVHFPLLNPDVAAHVTQIGEKAYIEECGEKARRAIRENPARFAKLTLLRAVDHWFGTTLTHANSLQTVVPASRQRQVVMLLLAGETVLVLFGLAAGKLMKPPCLWLLAILGLFSLVYLVTHVQIRFRVPIEPLMAVLVAMTLAKPTITRPLCS